MLSLYGQMDTDGENKTIFMIVRDDIQVEKWEEIHLRATEQTRELNGILYRVYISIRGSHTYNTKEMSTLIDGTISEAKDAGLTEAEIISTKEAKILREVYGIGVER